MTEDITSIIESLTENAESFDHIPVEIPSNGILYKNFKGVTLKPMCLEDEKALAQVTTGPRDAINTLIARCMEGIPTQDLLLMDRDYLLIKLREISFGEEFKAVAPCPQCQTDNNLAFTLSKLPAIPLPEDTEEPYTLHLPKINLEVAIKFPRIKDEVWLEPNNIETSLWRFVEGIRKPGEEDFHRDKEIIAPVLEKLSIADIHILLGAISLRQFGVQTRVKITCPACKNSSVIDIPLDQGFFTVTS